MSSALERQRRLTPPFTPQEREVRIALVISLLTQAEQKAMQAAELLEPLTKEDEWPSP